MIPLMQIPPTKGHGNRNSKEKKIGIKEILKNKRLVLLLCFGLCHYMCISCYNTFFSIYFSTDQGLNAGVGLFGLYYAIAIMGEAVVMLVGAKYFARFNVYNMFLLAPLAGIGRCLVVYFSPNPYIMMSAVVFQSLMFGPLSACLAPHIQTIVPAPIRATSQSLWSLMASGVGAILGSLISGVVVKLVGIHNLFLVIASAMFIVFIVFLVLFKRQRMVDLKEQIL